MDRQQTSGSADRAISAGRQILRFVGRHTQGRTSAHTRCALALLPLLLLPLPARGQAPIPPGTIVPVRLNGTLSSKNAKPGKAISASVMQDVPLPGGKKIRLGTKVTGHVIDVRTPAPGGSSTISFAFDRLLVSKAGVPVTTGLRALASVVAVDQTFLPELGMGEGESWNARTTEQVGGDTVYWGGGPVVGRAGPVGKPLDGADSGVLVKVAANPKGECRGEIGDNHEPQALWVFSSDACGVYGIEGLAIAHAGRTDPVGVIELASQRGEVKVGGGSGLLLRVLASSK
jgi:hypothetical protein